MPRYYNGFCILTKVRPASAPSTKDKAPTPRRVGVGASAWTLLGGNSADAVACYPRCWRTTNVNDAPIGGTFSGFNDGGTDGEEGRQAERVAAAIERKKNAPLHDVVLFGLDDKEDGVCSLCTLLTFNDDQRKNGRPLIEGDPNHWGVFTNAGEADDVDTHRIVLSSSHPTMEEAFTAAKALGAVNIVPEASL